MSNFHKSISFQPRSTHNLMNVSPQPEGFVMVPIGDLEAAIRSKAQRENSAWALKNVSVKLEIATQPEESLTIPVKDLETTMRARLQRENSIPVEHITKDNKFILRHFVLEEKSFLYHPRFISIGPEHRGPIGLQYMEDVKWAVVRDHFQADSTLLRDCIKCIKDMEDEARKSYQRRVGLSSDEFVQIMLVDSLFIITVLAECANVQGPSSIWDIPNIFEDMLLVENQVPFFIIRRIWDIIKDKVLEKLDLKADIGMNDLLKLTKFWEKGLSDATLNIDKAKHLLNLYYMWNVPIPSRVSHIPAQKQSKDGKGGIIFKPKANFLSATELYEDGIRFKPKAKFRNRYDISFNNGVLEIPTLILDSTNMSFMTNLLSYEINSYIMDEREHVGTIVASYVFFMDSLINTKKDVALLQQHDVLNNRLASDDEAAAFINTLGESVAIAKVDVDNNFYALVMKDIQQYSSPIWRHNWTSLRHTYFSNPWTGISVLAGSSLLMLAFVQTYYTVYPYYHANN